MNEKERGWVFPCSFFFPGNIIFRFGAEGNENKKVKINAITNFKIL